MSSKVSPWMPSRSLSRLETDENRIWRKRTKTHGPAAEENQIKLPTQQQQGRDSRDYGPSCVYIHTHTHTQTGTHTHTHEIGRRKRGCRTGENGATQRSNLISFSSFLFSILFDSFPWDFFFSSVTWNLVFTGTYKELFTHVHTQTRCFSFPAAVSVPPPHTHSHTRTHTH